LLGLNIFEASLLFCNTIRQQFYCMTVTFWSVGVENRRETLQNPRWLRKS
jgi:hypothetical protein